MELPSGELCSYERGIKSEQECREAAETLQMEFATAWNGNNAFPGCLIANDGRNKVYFNLSPTPSTTANNPAYGAICITTAGELLLKGKRTLFDMLSHIIIRKEIFPMVYVKLYIACLAFEKYSFKVEICTQNKTHLSENCCLPS